MTSDQVSTSVAAIEHEAEDILESARKQASEIVLKARDEAKNIISCKPPVDEFKKESMGIIEKAKDEAAKKVSEAENAYERIIKLAEPRVGGISERILNIVTGVASK